MRVTPVFSSNDMLMLRAAAIEGLGIAMLPELMVARALERATLTQVLPRVLVAETHLAVVYAEREVLPAHVRAFIEALVAWAPALEEPIG